MTQSIAAVILAAGKGTRMKSDLPKVMHKVAGLPMLGHVVKTFDKIKAQRIVTVLAPGREDVFAQAKGWVDTPDIVHHAVQDKPKGTGHAVMAAQDALDGFVGDVIVAFGDSPLVRPQTLEPMLDARMDGADIVLLGFRAQGDHMYGRIIVDVNGQVDRIVEHKDATPRERLVDLCNGGLMLVRSDHLWDLLDALDTNNAAGEYYLTEIVSVARRRGLHCAVVEGPAEDVLGVNSRRELANVEKLYQERRRAAAMEQGVTLVDPDTVWFAWDTDIEPDVVIEPSVFFGPGAQIASGATIHAFSHIEGAKVGPDATVGPYARLRPGATLEQGAKIGNFVEVKKSRIGVGSKANHLAYIGDADVGAGSNIGAGTITCNYDGFDKFQTKIGDNSFVGSNSTLVAPVTIGDNAFVGAGSVITKSVDDDTLGVARAKQSEIKGWVSRFRKRKAK